MQEGPDDPSSARSAEEGGNEKSCGNARAEGNHRLCEPDTAGEHEAPENRRVQRAYSFRGAQPKLVLLALEPGAVRKQPVDRLRRQRLQEAGRVVRQQRIHRDEEDLHFHFLIMTVDLRCKCNESCAGHSVITFSPFWASHPALPCLCWLSYCHVGAFHCSIQTNTVKISTYYSKITDTQSLLGGNDTKNNGRGDAIVAEYDQRTLPNPVYSAPQLARSRRTWTSHGTHMWCMPWYTSTRIGILFFHWAPARTFVNRVFNATKTDPNTPPMTLPFF